MVYKMDDYRNRLGSVHFSCFLLFRILSIFKICIRNIPGHHQTYNLCFTRIQCKMGQTKKLRVLPVQQEQYCAISPFHNCFPGHSQRIPPASSEPAIINNSVWLIGKNCKIPSAFQVYPLHPSSDRTNPFEIGFILLIPLV